MLVILNFTGLELWAPFNFSQITSILECGPVAKSDLNLFSYAINPFHLQQVYDESFQLNPCFHTQISIIIILCSSRKYPDPHHGGNLTQDPPTPLDFPFLQGTDGPPPLRNFHKCDKDPSTPLEKFIFTKKDY